MLRDPKPLVVGIAWVVECVEQRKRVDETKFLVDVEDMHYGTGTSKVHIYLPTYTPLRRVLTYLALKRRRSMLPRSMPSEMPLSSDTEREDGDADQSMDGSSSCKQAHLATFHPLPLRNAESIYSAMIIEVLPPLELARRRKSMLLGPRP